MHFTSSECSCRHGNAVFDIPPPSRLALSFRRNNTYTPQDSPTLLHQGFDCADIASSSLPMMHRDSSVKPALPCVYRTYGTYRFAFFWNSNVAAGSNRCRTKVSDTQYAAPHHRFSTNTTICTNTTAMLHRRALSTIHPRCPEEAVTLPYRMKHAVEAAWPREAKSVLLAFWNTWHSDGDNGKQFQ